MSMELCLCVAVILVAGSQWSHAACPNRCNTRGATGVASDAVSLTCDNQTIHIVYNSSKYQEGNLQTLVLTCSSPHSHNAIDYEHDTAPTCESVFNASIPNVQETQLFSLDIATTGNISHGSHCNVTGCLPRSTTERLRIFHSCTVPRDCAWGNWSQWSSCSCMGSQNHTRDIAVASIGSGVPCEDIDSVESRECEPLGCTSTSAPGCSEGCHGNATCEEGTCVCDYGFGGNGTHCFTEFEGDLRTVLVVVPVVASLLMATVLLLVIVLTARLLLIRRSKRLDHKRLEKLMGTFDPNFAPELTSNLKKVTATSEQSIFNSLWLTAGPYTKDYITLDELGIHINPVHKQYSSSEKSVELKFTDYSQRPSSQEDMEVDQTTKLSLDYRTMAKMFNLGFAYQNSQFSYGGDNTEPSDFIEDQLRIDISQSDDGDERYIGSHEGNNFIENSFKIDIDQSADNLEGEYINVGGVCFSYPSCDELETCSQPDEGTQNGCQNTIHSSSSLTALELDRSSNLVLSSSSPLY